MIVASSFDSRIRDWLLKQRKTFDRMESDANDMLIGKRVRITSKTFNGQPFGRSRKPLTGKVFKIQKVLLDGGGDGSQVVLWIGRMVWETLACGLEDVEFVE